MIKTGHDLTDMQIANGYNAITANITMPSYFYPLVADLARPGAGEKALDLGCGNGYLLAALAESFPNAILYGVELSPVLLQSAIQRLGERAEIQQSSVSAPLPYADWTFDVVTLTDVIEHLKQPEAVLGEIRRVLKPGGRAIITFPCGSLYSPFISLAEKCSKPKLARTFLPPEHPLKTFQPIDTVYFWGEMKQLLKNNGFIITEVIGRESFRYLRELTQYSRYNYKIVPLIYKAIVMSDKLINKIGLQQLCYRIMLSCKVE